MRTKTVSITSSKDVRVGDSVTLSKQGVAVTGKHRVCVSGSVHVELPTNPGARSTPTACTNQGWDFVGGTREVPAYDPGTSGTGLVNGFRVSGTWCEGAQGNSYFALHQNVVYGQRVAPTMVVREDQVTDFTPDMSPGISTEKAIKAMAETRAARRNGLSPASLRELVEAVINAIKRSGDS